jgi:hypothetical protein
MGPLQYMVMRFNRDYFAGEILPELARLSKKNVIRVVDLLFVSRDADSVVTSQELAQMLPDHAGMLPIRPDAVPEWFTQDDVEVVGESIPDNCSVALLLFEHRWASRLDHAVHEVNTSNAGDSPFESRALGIEQSLAAQAGVSRTA